MGGTMLGSGGRTGGTIGSGGRSEGTPAGSGGRSGGMGSGGTPVRDGRTRGRRLLALVVAFLAVACGDGPTAPRDRTGIWDLVRVDGQDLPAFIFDGLTTDEPKYTAGSMDLRVDSTYVFRRTIVWPQSPDRPSEHRLESSVPGTYSISRDTVYFVERINGSPPFRFIGKLTGNQMRFVHGGAMYEFRK